MSTAPKGKACAECFDLASGQAKPEYLDFVAQIKKELAATGISVWEGLTEDHVCYTLPNCRH